MFKYRDSVTSIFPTISQSVTDDNTKLGEAITKSKTLLTNTKALYPSIEPTLT